MKISFHLNISYPRAFSSLGSILNSDPTHLNLPPRSNKRTQSKTIYIDNMFLSCQCFVLDFFLTVLDTYPPTVPTRTHLCSVIPVASIKEKNRHPPSLLHTEMRHIAEPVPLLFVRTHSHHPMVSSPPPDVCRPSLSSLRHRYNGMAKTLRPVPVLVATEARHPCLEASSAWRFPPPCSPTS